MIKQNNIFVKLKSNQNNCLWSDSNRHVFQHQFLKLIRLPFRHKGFYIKIKKISIYVKFHFMLKIRKIFSVLEKKLSVKIKIVKKNINLIIFFILLSFLFGNIFGLNSQKFLFDFPGILFFVFPLFLEIINFLVFFQKKNSNKKFSFIMISIRRGFLLGIFIEAFKVGS